MLDAKVHWKIINVCSGAKTCCKMKGENFQKTAGINPNTINQLHHGGHAATDVFGKICMAFNGTADAIVDFVDE